MPKFKVYDFNISGAPWLALAHGAKYWSRSIGFFRMLL